MRRIPIPLLMLVFVIAFPVTVPIAIVLHIRDRRRMQGVAEKTRCERCGATLGVPSLRRADTAWMAHVAALQHTWRMMRFRLVRRVWAICAACSAEYGDDDHTYTFHRVAGDDLPGIAPTATAE